MIVLRPFGPACAGAGATPVVSTLAPWPVSRPLGREAGHANGGRPGWKAPDLTWTLPEPMLAAPMPDPALSAGGAAEVKWDGARAAVSVEAGHLVLPAPGGDLRPKKFAQQCCVGCNSSVIT
ncbi:hypothetical protein ACFYPB_13450 [Streptomyces olivaceoviridis]|uniref:hypothetical protein n=1 Tax=Streptomyces olivaceoviridis TaxID=1921 RepID=UPI003683A851